MDPAGVGGAHRAADLHRGRLLRRGLANRRWLRRVLPWTLLSHGRKIPDGDAARLFLRHRWRRGRYIVFSRHLYPAHGDRRLPHVPCGLQLRGLRHLRAQDLPRGQVPLECRFGYVSLLPNRHVLAISGLFRHLAMLAMPARARLRPSGHDNARGQPTVPRGLHVRRRHRSRDDVRAQMPRWLLLRTGDSPEPAVRLLVRCRLLLHPRHARVPFDA
mmetsp:Transcript_5244/g.11758  ORF Transcript_5244/g.11758 Transcript_5244/m.11758 type:complete len:216 (+) Transcript_5244:925-1572(+)